jgi:hypothetical protein
VVVRFLRQGDLGLQLVDSATGQVVLRAAPPEPCPQDLVPGLVLLTVGATDIRGHPAQRALNIIKSKPARPLTLTFLCPGFGGRRHANGAATNVRLQLMRPPAPMRWPQCCGGDPVTFRGRGVHMPGTLQAFSDGTCVRLAKYRYFRSWSVHCVVERVLHVRLERLRHGVVERAFERWIEANDACRLDRWRLAIAVGRWRAPLLHRAWAQWAAVGLPSHGVGGVTLEEQRERALCVQNYTPARTGSTLAPSIFDWQRTHLAHVLVTMIMVQKCHARERALADGGVEARAQAELEEERLGRVEIINPRHATLPEMTPSPKTTAGKRPTGGAAISVGRKARGPAANDNTDVRHAAALFRVYVCASAHLLWCLCWQRSWVKKLFGSVSCCAAPSGGARPRLSLRP